MPLILLISYLTPLTLSIMHDLSGGIAIFHAGWTTLSSRRIEMVHRIQLLPCGLFIVSSALPWSAITSTCCIASIGSTASKIILTTSSATWSNLPLRTRYHEPFHHSPKLSSLVGPWMIEIFKLASIQEKCHMTNINGLTASRFNSPSYWSVPAYWIFETHTLSNLSNFSYSGAWTNMVILIKFVKPYTQLHNLRRLTGSVVNIIMLILHSCNIILQACHFITTFCGVVAWSCVESSWIPCFCPCLAD